MDGGKDINPVPARPDEAQAASRIGVDDWVASHEGRRDRGEGLRRRSSAELERVPRPAFYRGLRRRSPRCCRSSRRNDYIVRVGFDTLLYMLLALGLNIVVGYAGLLDLGYVAFYGFGAYGYAMLASPKFGLHWDTLAIIPVVVVATAILGFLVALPSRRLLGDYLAIVTLFFGQLFVTVYQNGEPHLVPRPDAAATTSPAARTASPTSTTATSAACTSARCSGYYYVALIIFLLVLDVRVSRRPVAHRARVEVAARGSARRRADGHAGQPAEADRVRVRRRGSPASPARSSPGSTRPSSPRTSTSPTLIIVYAILILGGAGSLGGVILGALVVNVSLEVLRTPGHATWIFYVADRGDARREAPAVARLAVRRSAARSRSATRRTRSSSPAWPRGIEGRPSVGGWFGDGLNGWVLHPSNPRLIGNLALRRARLRGARC